MNKIQPQRVHSKVLALNFIFNTLILILILYFISFMTLKLFYKNFPKLNPLQVVNLTLKKVNTLFIRLSESVFGFRTT
ncbi:hypothetical protein N476_15005 [Pseudoalteromonas luteoviolacea H33]|uniref:Uncharacterized protein n=1 Tax=Pseudoalteromonas luteoviolacea H33 TaxID=1365251 RepID=A0A167EM66_9GAMM|nr:hypothetical protein N476_15005 [Pseudoalteromonas luteoviolacea H33]KZN75023.1 hypothetical protein N477_20645 [Pseudoalteromonas luteoviolacea H33-S]